MAELVTIVIPVYKQTLSDFDKISLSQCIKVLGNYPITLVKPHSLSLKEYASYLNTDFFVESFEDSYFEDVQGYNRLMLSSEFYRRFLNYEFILIYQLDAFVFKDELLYWCNIGYDYIGAPWLSETIYGNWFVKVKEKISSYIHYKKNIPQPGSTSPSKRQFYNRVGNGGFSLRRVEKFYTICLKEITKITFYNQNPDPYFNEDVFWSLEVNRKKKQLYIPNYREALKFSFEHHLLIAFKINKNKIPFGCHAWPLLLGFWGPIFVNQFDVIALTNDIHSSPK